MDLELTDEQKMLVESVRRFVREEIVPLEGDLDPDADTLHPEDEDRLVAKVKAMGLYGLDIPEQFGGPGIDIVTRSLLAMEMSQHRAGLYAPCYGVFGGAGLAQLIRRALPLDRYSSHEELRQPLHSSVGGSQERPHSRQC